MHKDSAVGGWLPGYAASKAALNSITLNYARILAESPIKINAVTPGLCQTDLTAGIPMTSRTAAQCALIAVRMAMLGADGPSGGFFDDDGLVPW